MTVRTRTRYGLGTAQKPSPGGSHGSHRRPRQGPFVQGEFLSKGTIQTGQFVTVDDIRFVGKVWRVLNIKVSRAVVRPHNDPDPRARGLDFPIDSYRTLVGEPEDFDAEGHRDALYKQLTDQAAAEAVPDEVLINVGAVVVIDRPCRGFGTRDLLVVASTRMTRNGMRATLNVLGGGRPGIIVPQSWATVVPLSNIFHYL